MAKLSTLVAQNVNDNSARAVRAATWLARHNHFEWMFNPLANPAYAKTSEAEFVADNDIVMAIVVGEDKRSVRAFERTIDGRKLEFFVRSGSSQLLLVDAETGSEWDFTGKAFSGPLGGRQLKKVAIL